MAQRGHISVSVLSKKELFDLWTHVVRKLKLLLCPCTSLVATYGEKWWRFAPFSTIVFFKFQTKSTITVKYFSTSTNARKKFQQQKQQPDTHWWHPAMFRSHSNYLSISILHIYDRNLNSPKFQGLFLLLLLFKTKPTNKQYQLQINKTLVAPL